MVMKKLISIVKPCYHEEENVEGCFKQVQLIFENLPQYDYEYIFIDNGSKDKTVPLLKATALVNTQVKIIVDTRNFGLDKISILWNLSIKGRCYVSFCL